MGTIAVPPEGVGSFTPTVELGIGPAEVFIAAALIYTFGYVYLLDAAVLDRDHQRAVLGTLYAAAVPLGLAFVSVILYATAAVL